MRTNLVSVVVAILSAGAFACGGGSGPSGTAPATNEDAGGDDGGSAMMPVEAGVPVEAAAPVDHGAPSTTYPAFPVSFGQLQNGGNQLDAPVIVAITWTSDTSQASFDAFADNLGERRTGRRPQASGASVPPRAERRTTCRSRPRRPPP